MMLDTLQEYGWTYLYTDGYSITGLATTLWMTSAAVLTGFVLSIPLALALCSKNPWLKTSVATFTYIFRGTPLFVQLLLIYSGIYSFTFVQQTPFLSAIFREGLNCALLAFILNTTAYTTEIFAGTIRTTKKSEIEACVAFGMTWWQMMRRVVLPSALRRAIPAYSNEVIYLLHATSIAFIVTVKDLMAVARDVNANTFRSFEAFGIAALLYLLTTFTLLILFRKAEARWLRYMKPARH